VKATTNNDALWNVPDYTLKLLAPAVGEKLIARGRVLKLGRTLSVAAADVFSVLTGEETLCATALATIRNYESPAPIGR
jgi:acyl-coenzyme A thioesterase PaaI-like protein